MEASEESDEPRSPGDITRELERALAVVLQQVVGHALRRLHAHARQAAQRVDHRVRDRGHLDGASYYLSRQALDGGLVLAIATTRRARPRS